MWRGKQTNYNTKGFFILSIFTFAFQQTNLTIYARTHTHVSLLDLSLSLYLSLALLLREALKAQTDTQKQTRANSWCSTTPRCHNSRPKRYSAKDRLKWDVRIFSSLSGKLYHSPTRWWCFKHDNTRLIVFSVYQCKPL